jgi:hypothetical protein
MNTADEIQHLSSLTGLCDFNSLISSVKPLWTRVLLSQDYMSVCSIIKASQLVRWLAILVDLGRHRE